MKINLKISAMLIALAGAMVNSSVLAIQIKSTVGAIDNQSDKALIVEKKFPGKKVTLLSIMPKAKVELGDEGHLYEDQELWIKITEPRADPYIIKYKPTTYEEIQLVVHPYTKGISSIRKGGAAIGKGMSPGLPYAEKVAID